MHERYFYPADVLSIALACSDRRFRLLPIPVVGASMLTYLRALFAIETMPMWSISGLVLLALVWAIVITVQTHAGQVSAEAVDNQARTTFPPVAGGLVYGNAVVCFGLFVAAITAAPAIRTQYDRSTVTGVLTYDTVTIFARNVKATRCADRIRLNITWSDTRGAIQLQGAHVFVHVLDQNQNMVAQGDGPSQPYPLLLTAFVETRNVPMAQPEQASLVKVGLYQFSEQGQRYAATRYDGVPWPDNAITLPIVDGVCG